MIGESLPDFSVIMASPNVQVQNSSLESSISGNNNSNSLESSSVAANRVCSDETEVNVNNNSQNVGSKQVSLESSSETSNVPLRKSNVLLESSSNTTLVHKPKISSHEFSCDPFNVPPPTFSLLSTSFSEDSDNQNLQEDDVEEEIVIGNSDSANEDSDYDQYEESNHLQLVEANNSQQRENDDHIIFFSSFKCN